jgi:hypothetical protein
MMLPVKVCACAMGASASAAIRSAAAHLHAVAGLDLVFAFILPILLYAARGAGASFLESNAGATPENRAPRAEKAGREDEAREDADGAGAARAAEAAKSGFVDAPFSATEPEDERETRDGTLARGDERIGHRDSPAGPAAVEWLPSSALDAFRAPEGLHTKWPPFRGGRRQFFEKSWG